ncbi:hypothetical protein, partial [Nitrosomonas sp.]|uniref:hypothetical protein n=1 Tax=Nitrosomonas sp. TaxID=42353 RepID=UPI00374C8DAE
SEIAFLLQPACSLTIFSMSTVYTKVSMISLNATEPAMVCNGSMFGFSNRKYWIVAIFIMTCRTLTISFQY